VKPAPFFKEETFQITQRIKQPFIPFNPSALDLVGPNKAVYEYRMMISHQKKGSRSPLRGHGSQPLLSIGTVDINENLQFQERLAKDRGKIKSYLRTVERK